MQGSGPPAGKPLFLLYIMHGTAVCSSPQFEPQRKLHDLTVGVNFLRKTERKRCMEESTTMESSIGPHYSVSEDKMDGYLSEDPVLNSSMCDLSDEEISTKKENHLRLGPEDLNDTLLCDF
ncbi:hypothetical protein MHYP_G00334330 [Metynnis hypsauchen]